MSIHPMFCKGAFYLGIPYSQRAGLEKTLIDLRDEEITRQRFLEIVANGVDTAQFVANLYKSLSMGIASKGDNRIKGEKFLNYHSWYINGHNSPESQLDCLCACHPDIQGKWERFLGDRGINPRKRNFSLCYFGECSKTEGLSIALWKTSVIVPDEDGYEKVEVIPELHIAFPKNLQLFRVYYRDPQLWQVINSCSAHKSKESLREAKEKRFIVKNEILYSFSDLIFDEDVLRNPPGIILDEETYKII